MASPSHIRPELVQSIAQANDIDVSVALSQQMVTDVEYRIKDVIQEAVKFMRHSKRDVLTSADINSALSVRNADSVYGYAVCDPPSMVRKNDVFVAKNEEKALAQMLNDKLPSVPAPLRLTSHWLSIGGVQPKIPQNPPVSAEGGDAAATSTSASVTPAGKYVHTLSREQQLYLDEMLHAVSGRDREVFAQAIDTLSREIGMSQLLPYFSNFLEKEVKNNMRNLPLLVRLMTFARAIVDNPAFNLEPYLHQFMPSILTCVVGKSLSASSSDNHWGLRERAASLVASICARWARKHTDLQPKISSTLKKALADLSRPLATHYGAIAGLTAFGYGTVRSVILPQVRPFLAHLDSKAADSPFEVLMCRGAIMAAFGCLFRGLVVEHAPLPIAYSAASEWFSEALVPLLPPAPVYEETESAPDPPERPKKRTKAAAAAKKSNPLLDVASSRTYPLATDARHLMI